LPRTDQTPLLGVFDHCSSHPILDRSRRVARFELCPDPHPGLGTQPLELDQRRVADRLDDVAIPPPAGLVLEALRGHASRSVARPRRPAIITPARGKASSRWWLSTSSAGSWWRCPDRG